MAKFINKKENVYQFKLTPYGHYLFSVGKFKPEFYGFYDDNIIYDAEYAGTTNETQNNIHKRIKQETQYLEGWAIFEDIEKGNNTYVDNEVGNYFEIDITPTMQHPRADIFRVEGMIGDAYLEGNTQKAPAWKVVTLDGTIKSSSAEDSVNNVKIPQLNIELNYFKKVEEDDIVGDLKSSDYRNTIEVSNVFADGNVIKLISEDLMVYAEELNTVLLTENFDVEIFEILTGAIMGTQGTPLERTASATDILSRKYFQKDYERIQGGLINESRYTSPNYNLFMTTSSVDYYFDVMHDFEISSEVACKGADIYNRDSYYIDLDFECDTQTYESVYNDIYGPVTEPEICL
jgi:hypothetical protein